MRPSLTFLLLILAILAVGVYFVVPRVGSHGQEARAVAAHFDINHGIKAALDQYKMDNGAYPLRLLDLVQAPRAATNWHGPYLDSSGLPADPWGNDYIYQYPGQHNTNSYDLFSPGPDGQAGTEDDIVNWAK